MSAALVNVSRRRVLAGLAGGAGLVLGARLLPAAALLDEEAAGVASPTEPLSPNAFLSVGADGTVTIVAHRSEMGTGIRTALPLVVADELDADRHRVRIVQAPGDERYGSQNTDGSRSIRRFFDTMREAGATARAMLEQAAARTWGVPVGECRADLHRVVHGPSGRALGYGALAEPAARLDVPEPDALRFKTRSRWRYVGRDVPPVDLVDMVTGRATFGLDARRAGTRFAVVARSPVLGGAVASYDDADALAIDGVERIVELPASTAPHGFSALGGIAVVARDTWAAIEGRRALRIEWDGGGPVDFDTTRQERELLEAVRVPGRVVRDRGDAEAALAQAARVIEAEYTLPHLAHASMEPPCALAEVTDGRCEAWAPTQNPQAARRQLARALELPPEAVTVHVTLLGGGFGRKSKPDYVVEAALLARETGTPVQVVWTREDDVRHDYFHAAAALRMEAGLDERDRVVAWRQRSAFPSISSTFRPDVTHGSAGELGLGFTDVPFDVPNLRAENGQARAHLRIGWLRSVCNVFHAFGVQAFADEVAAALGRDRVAFLHELIGRPRRIELAAEGVDYPNYSESTDRYPIDTGRLRAVLDRAAEACGWGRPLPRGRGRGVAVHRSFCAYVAAVVEVDVARDGTLAIPRVDVAADCGLLVAPDRVRAQMEGAVVFGTSLARTGKITVKDGRVEQGNFDDYTLERMDSAPREIHVHLVESDAPPAGAGEPGVPPVAPALCNAVFAATGVRVRRLPVRDHDLSWS